MQKQEFVATEQVKPMGIVAAQAASNPKQETAAARIAPQTPTAAAQTGSSAVQKVQAEPAAEPTEAHPDGAACQEAACTEAEANDAPALSDEEVLAHTAALWQYHPVPIDEPDPAPEYKTAEMKIGGADLIAARVRGKKHKHDGTNCDDWFAAAHVDDIAILAVSDGAGSKRFSRIGARAASETAVGAIYAHLCAWIKAHPAERAACALSTEETAFDKVCGRLGGMLHEGVRAARAAVEAAFYERCGRASHTALLGRELVLSDFAATLLVTIAVPLPARAELLVLSCQIGDGMTAAVHTRAAYGSAVKLLGKPDSGDYVGETDFLTSEGVTDAAALRQRTLVTCGAYNLLLTMTDGVADDYFSEKEMHRLYMDLTMNGILSSAHGNPMFTRTEVDLLRSLPAPEAFPWINDKEKRVALQYAQRCCRMAGCTEEMLWAHAHVLSLAAEDTSLKEVASPVQRLEIWLDNYMARGSFDDRTLMLLWWGDAYV